jgi:hypothetical protein
VPLGIAVAAVQASIYDVPGGFRAVMFDRFSGVRDQVCSSPACDQGHFEVTLSGHERRNPFFGALAAEGYSVRLPHQT